MEKVVNIDIAFVKNATINSAIKYETFSVIIETL